MSVPNRTPLVSVIVEGGRCIGFVMRRRPGEVEAFSAREKSLGLFADEADAIDAVLKWIAPPDPGIAPGGIRDRALSALKKSGAAK